MRLAADTMQAIVRVLKDENHKDFSVDEWNDNKDIDYAMPLYVGRTAREVHSEISWTADAQAMLIRRLISAATFHHIW
jgi:hypothetical protein